MDCCWRILAESVSGALLAGEPGFCHYSYRRSSNRCNWYSGSSLVEQAVGKTSTAALQTYYPLTMMDFLEQSKGYRWMLNDSPTHRRLTCRRICSSAGTPSQMLALPYDKIGQATTCLQTTQPIQALSGTVAPWFGQIGGGTQYHIDRPVE